MGKFLHTTICFVDGFCGVEVGFPASDTASHLRRMCTSSSLSTISLTTRWKVSLMSLPVYISLAPVALQQSLAMAINVMQTYVDIAIIFIRNTCGIGQTESSSQTTASAVRETDQVLRPSRTSYLLLFERRVALSWTGNRRGTLPV
jgi:hypothetical protein